MNINNSIEYKLICDYYGEKTARRTGVKLINHIDEGLRILSWIGAGESAHKAYCLHPIFQADEDLQANYNRNYGFYDPAPFILAMEYRNIANQYLSLRTIHSVDEIKLSPIPEVNQMLIADKIQNRKDFELYHKETHPRSTELVQYFANWLEKLEVSEEMYIDFVERLHSGSG